MPVVNVSGWWCKRVDGQNSPSHPKCLESYLKVGLVLRYV